MKPLVGSQSFVGMLGYVSKLPLEVRLWNVTPGELAEGQKQYQLVRTDPMIGKRGLNKSNFIKEVYSFWHRHLRPCGVPTGGDHAVYAVVRRVPPDFDLGDWWVG